MDSLNKRFPLYSKVLKLYPKKYQKEYGKQVLQTTADMLDDAPNTASKLAIWTRITVDLPVNITKQQLQYSGGSYMNQTPTYIKRNSIICGVLLAPFFAALIANSIDKIVNNHTLYASWLWQSAVIRIWVLYLPEAAFLLAAVSYIVYLSKNTESKHSKFLKRVLDIRRSWPILIPAMLSFGVLFVLAFHDVGQCWVQNPAHLVGHLNHAWECSVNNQSLTAFRKFL